jgi:DNA-binding CsgD family transcriptional regulator
MLDERMQCLECNPAARQGLREGAVTLLDDGSLRFTDPALKLGVKRVSTLAGGRRTQLLSSQRDAVTLLCMPVRKSDAPGRIARVRTIVWVLAGHSLVAPSPESLKAIFNITHAEARLLHLLCKIGNVSQSAELLSVSVHTARTQLKSIMAKLNANSQVQLVSQAMGHALVQTVQPPALRQTPERTLTLTDGRVLSWFEYGDPDGRRNSTWCRRPVGRSSNTNSRIRAGGLTSCTPFCTTSCSNMLSSAMKLFDTRSSQARRCCTKPPHAR